MTAPCRHADRAHRTLQTRRSHGRFRLPGLQVGAGGLLLALGAAALLARPALAAVDPDHEKPILLPGEEAAWLADLLSASPHREAFDAAMARGDLPAPAAADDGPAHAGAVLPPPPPASAWPKKPGRRFFGYLPYWTKASAVLPWSALTQVGWFSAGLKTDATFSTVAGWGGAEAKAFIALAHQKGVQVVLTITLFNTAGISTVLASDASRKKAVDAIVALVIQGGGDGVNIDFEGLAKADRDEMKAFTALLTDTMHKALPGSDVTLATPCVDWSGAWDYKYLTEHSDGLFIMAYGIHWSGGPPGPQLPMAALAPWKHKTLQWVVDDYLQWATVANKAKIIVGLPLYGQTWLSNSPNPGAGALATGKSIFYSAAQDAAAKAGGWKWDKTSESPFFVQPSGASWNQTWCDDFKAWTQRVDYVDQRDVMMGVWALGYTDGDPAVMEKAKAWRDKGGGSTVADAGTPDAGSAVDTTKADAGSTTDLGKPDVSPSDAGPVDAGTADAGKADAGTADAGSAPDANKPDAASTADVLLLPEAGAPVDVAPAETAAGTDTATADADDPPQDVGRAPDATPGIGRPPDDAPPGPGAPGRPPEDEDAAAPGGDALATDGSGGDLRAGDVGAGAGPVPAGASGVASSGCGAARSGVPAGPAALALVGLVACAAWARRRSSGKVAAAARVG